MLKLVFERTDLVSRWYNDIQDYMLMKEFGTQIFVYNCQLTMKSKVLSLLPEFEFFGRSFSFQFEEMQ